MSRSRRKDIFKGRYFLFKKNRFAALSAFAALCAVFFTLPAACSSVPEEPEKIEEPKEIETGDTRETAGAAGEDPAGLPPENRELPVSAFAEVWGYLINGREADFRGGMPLTDIGYFGAEIDTYGKLTGVPNPRNVRGFGGRIHMVVACNGKALSHFALAEGSPERRALIADLLRTAENFDGLQIDFENIPQRDGRPFLSFLAELRAGLPGKLFTIALPARTRAINADVYDYVKIKPLVDRILVMAYDEHWSGSRPGPVASMDWCRRVAEYSLEVVGREKLIMGLPFYGRAWGHISPSRAYIYSGIQTIIDENSVQDIRRENGVPSFDYDVTVSVKVYYEDDYSLSARMEMYRSMGVRAVGFWRIGQEIPSIWDLIQLIDNNG
ncbi:MAG: glycoside hydrolase [Treponema sp.]|nr:glycoside hydrolase [Treponema sp.]